MKKYLLLFICFVSFHLCAQENKNDSTASGWRFSAWAEMFILPGQEDYFNPTFYARHNTLHLEGRFNYEDRNTASLWAGRRFKFGNPVEFVIVPMGAVVFGNTNGLAPGLETEIMFKKFDFYTESEYLFDFSTSENNFFYMYSELAIRPIKPLRTGLIAQRTKLFQTEFEIQRGLFAEYYFKRYRAGVFYFNPFDSDNQFWIASFSVDF
jgi:hypothetical protein